MRFSFSHSCCAEKFLSKLAEEDIAEKLISSLIHCPQNAYAWHSLMECVSVGLIKPIHGRKLEISIRKPLITALNGHDHASYGALVFMKTCVSNLQEGANMFKLSYMNLAVFITNITRASSREKILRSSVASWLITNYLLHGNVMPNTIEYLYDAFFRSFLNLAQNYPDLSPDVQYFKEGIGLLCATAKRRDTCTSRNAERRNEL